jgi:hypothetical protein
MRAPPEFQRLRLSSPDAIADSREDTPGVGRHGFVSSQGITQDTIQIVVFVIEPIVNQSTLRPHNFT